MPSPPSLGRDSARERVVAWWGYAALLLALAAHEAPSRQLLGASGTYHRARPRDGGAEVKGSGKLMRVLRRQGDSSWKVARAIWTAIHRMSKTSGSIVRAG